MAVITFGSGYVGKIDRVPGRCYVVTKVFQVINVPLIPLAGYLVEEGSETQSFVAGLTEFNGRELPISWKSFAWGIARAAMFAGGLLAMLGLFVIWFDVRGAMAFVAGPVFGIGLLALWWKTRRGLVATPERAAQLEALLAKPRSAQKRFADSL